MTTFVVQYLEDGPGSIGSNSFSASAVTDKNGECSITYKGPTPKEMTKKQERVLIEAVSDDPTGVASFIFNVVLADDLIEIEDAYMVQVAKDCDLVFGKSCVCHYE